MIVHCRKTSTLRTEGVPALKTRVILPALKRKSTRTRSRWQPVHGSPRSKGWVCLHCTRQTVNRSKVCTSCLNAGKGKP